MNLFIDPTHEQTNQLLVDIVHERLVRRLAEARPGHCLRVSALPESVMRTLCGRFQGQSPTADVVLLLGPGQLPRVPYEVTATRLIELRNAGARPLLAFVPPGLKAAAEDSFDVSTFAEVPLADTGRQLRDRLYEQLPDALRAVVRAVVDFATSAGAGDEDVALYYQTLLANNATPAAVGGAIYQFGLIPHFALADSPNLVRPEMGRNRDAVQALDDSPLPLLGRIHTLKLETNTLQGQLYAFLRRHGTRGPRHWTRLIATEPEAAELAFDQWRFAEEVNQTRVLIWFDELVLPRRQPDQLPGNDNPPTLDISRTKDVRLSWRLEVKPGAVPGLSYYRLELVDADHTVIWESRNLPVGKGQSLGKSKRLKVAEFKDRVADEGDEGMYFFRVRAYSEAGEVLNQEDPQANPRILRDRDNSNSKRIYESENFWLWNGGGEGPDVEPPRNVAVASFEEARLLTHLALIDKGEDPLQTDPQPREDRTGWGTKTTSRQREAIYHIVYDAQTSYTLAVNTVLRRLEQMTLAQPEHLGRLGLDFTDPTTTPDRATLYTRLAPPGPVPDVYLSARETLFGAIAGPAGLGLVATADLLALEDTILAYGRAYEKWLDDDGASAALLDLDTVDVRLTGGERARLMGPTHPLRLLWRLQMARLTRAWLTAALAQGSARERLSPSIRDFLRRGLAPTNLPLVLLDAAAPSFAAAWVEQGALTPFWSLYVPQTTRDKQTLRAQAQRALGISHKATPQADEIDPAVLARKLGHYLAQHPYLHTLTINAFNPGNAGLIVDALLLVESERSRRYIDSPLRYELRLFTQSDRPDDVGEAVEDLTNPDRQVKAEADAFTVAGRNHLFPKLRFSRHQLDDFLQNPRRFEAHVSLLRDLFPVAATAVANAAGRSSYLHGLIQEQVTTFAGNEQHFYWQRQLTPRPTPELDEGPPVAALLASLLDKLGRREVAVVSGDPQPEQTAGLALDLPIAERSLLYEVHAVSDWVFTIDRYLGLEYFDSTPMPGRPMYLLDFTPSYAHADAERLLLTTRVVDEVARIVRPVLRDNDLEAAVPEAELVVLQLLRSLSGRLALRLIAAPNQGKEALSLALARLFLEAYDLLREAVIIPLDAHTDLFAPERAPDGEAISPATRGDLLLVTAVPVLRQLNCHIIEVKWRANLSGFSESNALRQEVARQLNETEHTLRRHFDPHFAPVDRLDRSVKTKELMTLLGFYLDRAQRYGLVGQATGSELRAFFQSLDAGYRLVFSGSGLFFDRAFDGLSSDGEPNGRAYHRIGRDLTRRLLERAPRPAAARDEPDAPHRPPEPTLRDDPTYATVRALFPLSPAERARDRAAQPRPTPPPRPAGPANGDTGAPQPPPVAPPSVIRVTPEPRAPEPGVAEADSLLTPVFVAEAGPPCDVLLGLDSPKLDQYGLLGTAAGKRLALDLNGTNTISLFGVQGGGKSYSVGTIVEMATRPLPGLNRLPSPLATVIFHYHESQDYAPEFVSMIRPNGAEAEVAALAEQYGAQPAALEEVLLLTSPDMVAARRREFPGVRVAPILFGSSELGIKEWRFLMGVTGNQMYMKQMTMLIRQLRRQDGAMQLDALRQEIDASALSDMQKTILSVRLNLAGQFIDDAVRLGDYIRPGRLIIVDLRDETIEKDEALGLFVVMLNIFAAAGRQEGYNKLIVFDEAHKYMDNRDLTGHIVDAIRQMRHQGVSLLIASQDPPSLPNEIIELSSLVILHRFNSPQWLKHVQRSVTALSQLTAAEMSGLRPGEAFIWAAKATEPLFTHKAVRVRLRPRATEHGGGTRTAL